MSSRDLEEPATDLHPLHTVSIVEAPFPVPSAGKKLGKNRWEKARLNQAGFLPILDTRGRRLNSIEMGRKINVELELEDALKVNELVFEFRGITLDTVKTGYFPESVYFTYQFYDLPSCTTERVNVYTGPVPIGGSSRQRAQSVPAAHHRRWSAGSNGSFRSVGGHADDGTDIFWPGILWRSQNEGTGPACKHWG